MYLMYRRKDIKSRDNRLMNIHDLKNKTVAVSY